MVKLMRLMLVAFLVATLTISPAVACHYCGGGFGGGHYSGGYYTGCHAGGYYESGCCGGAVVVESGCGDCGGCSDCGASEGCGCEGAATELEPQMQAPEPPASTPATVNRVPTEPAPALPTYREPVPSTEPIAEPATPVLPPTEPAADSLTPPTESTTLPVMEAPVAEPATPSATEMTPPPSTTDDLFGPPSTPATDEAPLPAEEPATPAETEDFFSEPATDSAPATDAAAPDDNDLFGPPAEEEQPAEEEKPVEDVSDDDLFGKADAILGLPGGLASGENRHWVDNTGNFSCDGRLLRFVDGKVQILKATGRTTTVPLARLSKGDLEFVNRQAMAQKAESLSKTAQVSSAR